MDDDEYEAWIDLEAQAEDPDMGDIRDLAWEMFKAYYEGRASLADLFPFGFGDVTPDQV